MVSLFPECGQSVESGSDFTSSSSWGQSCVSRPPELEQFTINIMDINDKPMAAKFDKLRELHLTYDSV